MIIVCAWCNKTIGEKGPKDDDRVSHGICDQCHAKLIAEQPRIDDGCFSGARGCI